MKCISLFVLVFCFCTVANAKDYPRLKEGLWESTIQGKERTLKSKMCFGREQTLKELFESANRELRGSCEKISIENTGENTFTSRVTCDLGITQMEATSVMSGDFSRAYTVRTVTKMDPPIMGRSGGVTESRSVYKGSCGELKPGEVLSFDGTKFNMNELGKQP